MTKDDKMIPKDFISGLNFNIILPIKSCSYKNNSYIPTVILYNRINPSLLEEMEVISKLRT